LTYEERETEGDIMDRLLRSSVAVALASALLLTIAAARVDAQGGNAPASKPAGPTPRLADGKPDMTGVWVTAGQKDNGLDRLEKLYNAAAQKQQASIEEADDPLFRCLPYGVPRSILSSPWPFQVVQRVGTMLVLTEYYHAFRIIPTDGSPHTPDALPTYFGDSVARWDGDTLVVDITGFNGKTWLADARDRPTPTSRGAWIHSDALHVVERWRMVNADAIEYQAIVEDPKMLTGPWTAPTVTLRRQQEIKKIGEGMCFDTTTYDLARPSAGAAPR
jgi:hypothetical protein